MSRDKTIYIKPATRRRIDDILTHNGFQELKLIDNCSNAFSTTSDKRISNTDAGNLFIGDIKNQIKLGKILRASTEMLDNEIETIVTAWKAQYIVDTSRVIVTDDVPFAYQMNSVGGSCMASQSSDFFEIYTDIGSQVAYVMKNGEMTARALLHDLTNHNTNMRFKAIDRIFYDNENDRITINKWAEENGYKKIYSEGLSLFSSPIQSSYEAVPYVDTLYSVVRHAGELRLSCGMELSTLDTLNSTEGASDSQYICDRYGEDYVYCEDDGERIHVDSAFWLEDRQEYYSSDYHLNYISEYGYVHEDNDDYAYDENTGEYADKDNLKYTIDGDYTSSDDYISVEYGQYGGDGYAHADDVIYCEDVCGYCHVDDEPKYITDKVEWWLEDESYQHEDGNWYSCEEVDEDDDIEQIIHESGE